nr:hypothetical protein [Sicyoidochytrium minutum DNA virus]
MSDNENWHGYTQGYDLPENVKPDAYEVNTRPIRVEQYADTQGDVPLVLEDNIDPTKRPESTGDPVKDLFAKFSYKIVNTVPSLYLSCFIIGFSQSTNSAVLETKRTQYIAAVTNRLVLFYILAYVAELVIETLYKNVSYALSIFQGVVGFLGVARLFLWIIDWFGYMAWLFMVLLRMNLYLTAFACVITGYIKHVAQEALFTNTSTPFGAPDPTNLLLAPWDMRLYRTNISGTGSSWYSYTYSVQGQGDQPTLQKTVGNDVSIRENFVGKLAYIVEYSAFSYNTNVFRAEGSGIITRQVGQYVTAASKVANTLFGFYFVDQFYQEAMNLSIPVDQSFYYSPIGNAGTPGGTVPESGIDNPDDDVTTGAVGGVFIPGEQRARAIITQFALGSAQICDAEAWAYFLNALSSPDLKFTKLVYFISQTAILRTYVKRRGYYYSIYFSPYWNNNNISDRGRMKLMRTLSFIKENRTNTELFGSQGESFYQEILADIASNTLLTEFLTYEYFAQNLPALEAIGFDLEYFTKELEQEPKPTGSIPGKVIQTMVGNAVPDFALSNSPSEIINVPAKPVVKARIALRHNYVQQPNCGDKTQAGSACCSQFRCSLMFRDCTKAENSFTCNMDPPTTQ